MRFHRKFRKSLQRLVVAGMIGGAGFAPAAMASTVVQQNGQLIPSAQVQARSQVLPLKLLAPDDAAQLRAERYGRTAQIGGYSTAKPDVATASAPSASFDWRDTVIGIAAFLAALTALGAAFVLRRRAHLSPA